ncbi:MAG: ORF6N domain-containing protein [Bacteroidetes bacterium]|nr:ORF6N domain-containing protein [Bacteroidota bacterium]
MFELTEEELSNLRSQIVTSSWGGQRYLPFVFTELGILQLANVIRSIRARKMGIRIIEIFVKMREMILLNKELFIKLEHIKQKLSSQDEQLLLIFEYLK